MKKLLALLSALSLLLTPALASAQSMQFSNPGATGSSVTTGTSGHTVPYLDGANTWSAIQTYNARVDIAAAEYVNNTQIYFRDNTLTSAGILSPTVGSLLLDSDLFNFRSVVGVSRATLGSSGFAAVGTISGSNLGTDGLPASIATSTIIGRSAAGTGAASALTAAATKTLLAIANTDVSGLGTASTAATGTSGHTLGFLDAANTISNDLTIFQHNLFWNDVSAFGGFGGNGNGRGWATAAGGLNLAGQGSSYDLSLTNKSGTTAIRIPTGTTNAEVVGSLAVGGATVFNSSGVLQAAGFPALTGDVTTSAGSLATTLTSATVVSKVSAQALAPASVAATGVITSSGATSGIGYATGAGGAVTQITSRTTGVTNNKACGAITMFSAAGSATWATFTVTDSAVAATDTIIANQKSGTNLYLLAVTAVAAGSFGLSFATTGGTATDAPVINYCVVKGVAA